MPNKLEHNDKPPMDGTIIMATIKVPMKWENYAPNSTKAKAGKTGRWVTKNQYGIWGMTRITPDEWVDWEVEEENA